jgi:hypothetical protein
MGADRFPVGVKIVLAVTKPIPGFGALPGDEIVVRPSDPDFPIVLRRSFEHEMLNAIPMDSVTELYAVPDAGVPSPPAVSESPAPPALPAPTPLRLVG